MQTKFKNHEVRGDLVIYYGKAVKMVEKCFEQFAAHCV
jgi:hypothetical protein